MNLFCLFDSINKYWKQVGCKGTEVKCCRLIQYIVASQFLDIRMLNIFRNNSFISRTVLTALAFQLVLSGFVPALAAASSVDSKNDSSSSGGSGTLLLPLTPKIDSAGLAQEDEVNDGDEDEDGDNGVVPIQPPDADTEAEPTGPVDLSKNKAQEPYNDEGIVDPRRPFSLEVDEEDDDEAGLASQISEDTTLKGTIQIVADDTEYDSEKNTFLGTGNAVCVIGGQNSRLEADMILYDQNEETIDARGHVTILREGQVTTGKSFKFKVNSDEYLITKPDTEVNGANIVARAGKGANGGLAFKDGTLQFPTPFVFQKSQYYGPVGHLMELAKKKAHPDAYMPAKPSYKFTARRMVYEKYKDQGNLTIFGGRMMFGKFGVPLPKLNATITKDGNDMIMPIAPALGSNMQVGGINLGPQFNTLLPNGKGVVSWSPMLQIGGRTLDGRGGGSGLGLAGQATITTKKLKAGIATGSVNNIMVADLHYRISPHLRLQSGINRFMDDGMFGFRRARLAAELVDTRMTNKIPFLSYAAARSSAGWMQDNPQLVNLSPNYAQLFGPNQFKTVMNSGFKLQEQITFTTHPLFAIGNDKYGLKSYIYGGGALRAYSSGDASAIGQLGPVLSLNLNRFHLQTNYNQSVAKGSSPFVFDQFIQGQRSLNMMGDVKVNKYLTLGAGMGYNLSNKLFYSRTITAAIGPEDFKVLLTRDMVTGINRVGFDILYGAPVPFKSLSLKGNPDHGQLGGI